MALNWNETLAKAQKHINAAENMLKVTYDIFRESRLLIKIFMEIHESLTGSILALLHYKGSMNQIPLFNDPKLNFKVFKDKVAVHYLGPGDMKRVFRILSIGRKHRESPLEFVKNDKFVIFLGDSYEVLTIGDLREFLQAVKNFERRVRIEIGNAGLG